MIKLYRRDASSMLLDVDGVIDVTAGGQRNVYFQEAPGWYAVDVCAKVAEEAGGGLGRGRFLINVDGVTKVSLRASWGWTRQYIYCAKGYRQITFQTTEYKPGDVAKVRYQNAQYFRPLPYVLAITENKMPKPLEEMTRINLLNGFSRYQGSGPRGAEIEFAVMIKGRDGFEDFMGKLQNYYIAETDEGLYGGVLLPHETDPEKLRAGLYRVKTVLHSPSLAGVGC